MREVTGLDLARARTSSEFVRIAGKAIHLRSKYRENRAPNPYPLQRSTVWSFPERGDWATHDPSYRGNWSPHVPRNLILHYTRPGETVLDPMCGSGTSLVEARLLGRNAIGVDVNPDATLVAQSRLEPVPPTAGSLQRVFLGDARCLTQVRDGSIDLVVLHPPYANIIRYTDGENRNDLSSLHDAGFFAAMTGVAAEACRVLRADGHCAVLMGDTRKRSHVVPLSFEILNNFLRAGMVLREHIIKLQHNTYSAASWTARYDFLLLAHENLFVLRKPPPSEVASIPY